LTTFSQFKPTILGPDVISKLHSKSDTTTRFLGQLCFYLFIYLLSRTDTVSRSDYKFSNNRMNNALEGSERK